MNAFVSKNWRLAIFWTLSLLAMSALTAMAQNPPLGVPGGLITEAPTIVSGADLGFRLERTRNDIAVGRLVVRVNGRWIETGSAATVVPARQ